MDATNGSLASWQNFYVIVGSSAGALTGLQFVVIALVAQARAARSMIEIGAFGTPNIVHFSSALLVSGIMSMPWTSIRNVGGCLIVCGIVGFGYCAAVVGRARRQAGYKPDAEDWIWFFFLPMLAYAVLLVSAVFLPSRVVPSLFAIAATILLLLFVGIHNAWDSVTYVAIHRSDAPREH